jgi:hypothetical protein
MATPIRVMFNGRWVKLPKGTQHVYTVASRSYGYRLRDGSYLTQRQLEQIAASQVVSTLTL